MRPGCIEQQRGQPVGRFALDPVEYRPQPAQLAVQMDAAPADRRDPALIVGAAVAEDMILDRFELLDLRGRDFGGGVGHRAHDDFQKTDRTGD